MQTATEAMLCRNEKERQTQIFEHMIEAFLKRHKPNDRYDAAEFERELIRSRTGEGRERAKARGVILGRKPKLTGHQRREAIARREAGEVLTDIARSYNVSHSTISRLS